MLLGDIDIFIAIGAAADDRLDGRIGLGETAMRFRRPLHWRAAAFALGQAQIVTHSDLVPYRSTGVPGNVNKRL